MGELFEPNRKFELSSEVLLYSFFKLGNDYTKLKKFKIAALLNTSSNNKMSIL